MSSAPQFPLFRLPVWRQELVFYTTKSSLSKSMKKKNHYKTPTYRIMFGYSLSLPCESRHLRYITDASTLAGEYVFGSFSNDMTDSKMVRTFCVGFHRSHGSSPLCGSSTGGCKIEIHKSPFCNHIFYYKTD